MTSDLSRRTKEHQRGKVRSTRNKGKFVAKVIEECGDRKIARKREKYWKSGCGKEKLKKLYSGVEQSGSSRGS